MKVILSSFIVLGLIGIPVMGRILERCDAARQLLMHEITRDQLADWVCLMQYQSNFNTGAINNYNIDGSRDYGLFQINSRKWCVEGRPGNDCNVNCYDLLSDDMSASISCAKLIYSKQGFYGWAEIFNFCMSGRSPSVDDCFIKK